MPVGVLRLRRSACPLEAAVLWLDKVGPPFALPGNGAKARVIVRS